MAKGVRKEAAAPPIAFPWKRALPGLVLCPLCGGDVRGGVPAKRASRSARNTWPIFMDDYLDGTVVRFGRVLRAANVGGLGWIILALLLTLGSVMLSLRLIRRRI